MSSITPDRWRRLSPYLDEALDTPTRERGSILAELRARDAALAADLQALLSEREAADASGFLSHGIGRSMTAATAQVLAGRVIGPYRLVSLLGQGGMGSVWLGERCDDRFDRPVAIKLLNTALVGTATEERFLREGRILAGLVHPRIAQLFDAGRTDDGQPYLALEYVDGQTIERYCDENILSIPTRLRLFLDLLEAVEYAHRHGVVHRDLKPDNVLVSTSATIKLIDFGIAKMLDRDDSATFFDAGMSSVTRDAGRALTPQYAAPEQLTGEPVTGTTDVYALGALLYVLLTGQHPAGPLAQPPATLMRAILEKEPARPSDAVTSDGDTQQDCADYARLRGSSPTDLRRILRGDLDRIVGKALRKAACQRYQTVSALADDLRGYLDAEPTEAMVVSPRVRRCATFASVLRTRIRRVA